MMIDDWRDIIYKLVISHRISGSQMGGGPGFPGFRALRVAIFLIEAPGGGEEVSRGECGMKSNT